MAFKFDYPTGSSPQSNPSEFVPLLPGQVERLYMGNGNYAEVLGYFLGVPVLKSTTSK